MLKTVVLSKDRVTYFLKSSPNHAMLQKRSHLKFGESRLGRAFQNRLWPWMARAEPYRDVFTGVFWKALPNRLIPRNHQARAGA